MKISELKNAPQWLLNASTAGANVDIVRGVVTWKGGTWENGIWKGGIWRNGTWKGGTWKNGTWENGIWEAGIWKAGTWKGGIWRNGTWKGGTWKAGTWKGGTWGNGTWENGIWEAGIWKAGTWRNGTWKGGIWEAGVWRNGTSVPRSAWVVKASNTGDVSIGCVTKSIEAWDIWFAGTDTYDTPRDTERFRMIQAHYEAVKCWVVKLQQDEPETEEEAAATDPASDA